MTTEKDKRYETALKELMFLSHDLLDALQEAYQTYYQDSETGRAEYIRNIITKAEKRLHIN